MIVDYRKALDLSSGECIRTQLHIIDLPHIVGMFHFEALVHFSDAHCDRFVTLLQKDLVNCRSRDLGACQDLDLGSAQMRISFLGSQNTGFCFFGLLGTFSRTRAGFFAFQTFLVSGDLLVTSVFFAILCRTGLDQGLLDNPNDPHVGLAVTFRDGTKTVTFFI